MMFGKVISPIRLIPHLIVLTLCREKFSDGTQTVGVTINVCFAVSESGTVIGSTTEDLSEELCLHLTTKEIDLT